MYLKFMKNLSKLKLNNGTFIKGFTPLLSLEDQKPFVFFKSADMDEFKLCFISGDNIYMTPFRQNVDSGTLSRFKTVLYLLDKEPKEINLATYLTRNGIPITELSFVGKIVIFKEINFMHLDPRNPITKANLVGLFRDIRDVLYY